MSSNKATNRVSSLDSSKPLIPREQVRAGGTPPVQGAQRPLHARQHLGSWQRAGHTPWLHLRV